MWWGSVKVVLTDSVGYIGFAGWRKIAKCYVCIWNYLNKDNITSLDFYCGKTRSNPLRILTLYCVKSKIHVQIKILLLLLLLIGFYWSIWFKSLDLTLNGRHVCMNVQTATKTVMWYFTIFTLFFLVSCAHVSCIMHPCRTIVIWSNVI